MISGRAHELQLLQRFFSKSRHETGGVYWVLGQKGIGKTALLERVQDDISWDQSIYCLKGNCEDGTEKSPFFCVLNALTAFFHLDNHATELQVLNQIAPRWYSMVRNSSISETGGSSSKGPVAIQSSPIPELCAFIDWLLERRPVVLIIEDAHWMDAETVSLLGLLFSRTPRRGLCALVSVRTESLDRNEAFSRLFHSLELLSHSATLALNPLSEDGVHGMLREEFREAQIETELAPLLHKLTDGIPLVLDNAIGTLKKSGLVRADDNSRNWRLSGSADQVRRLLKPGLESLVNNAIRDMKAAEKLLLMAGSIQGAEFDSRIVSKATGVALAECEILLRSLSDSHGFIKFVGEENNPLTGPSLRFRFDHSFYQDCLRSKLIGLDKRRMYEAVADALDADFPGGNAQNSVEIAELYSTAGKPDKECKYRVLAAIRQLSFGACSEAIESAKHAERLYAVNPQIGDQESHRDAMVIMAVSLTVLNGYANEDAQRAYRKSIAIAKSADLPAHFPSLYGLWMNTLVRGDMIEANEKAQEMLDLANTEERLIIDRTQAHWAMGVTQYFTGKVATAREHFEAGIRLYEQSRHSYYASSYVLDPGVANRYLLARTLWFLGYPDQASAKVEESLILARQLEHVESLGFALVSAAMVHSIRGEVFKVKECAKELLGISAEAQSRQHRPWAQILNGWAIGIEGQPLDGLQELREGLANYEKLGAKIALSGFYVMEMELCHRAELFDEERCLLDKALLHMTDTGQFYYHPEFLRLVERNLLSRGLAKDPWQRIARLEAARQVAIEMNSRSGELRIVTDLARAMSNAGEPLKALKTLIDCLETFTEGFETEDVKRAVQLRGQLESTTSGVSER